MADAKVTTRLQALIHRTDCVLTVLYALSAGTSRTRRAYRLVSRVYARSHVCGAVGLHAGFPNVCRLGNGENAAKQWELEKRYYPPAMLGKYRLAQDTMPEGP